MHLDIAAQVTVVAVTIMFVGAVGVLDVEREAPGSNIHSFGDAMWWALTTITTVGYGDKYPVTTQGRLIAAAIMLTGIAVLGVVTASVAGWFVESLQTIQREEVAEADRARVLEAQLEELLQRMARIESHLANNSGLGPAPEPGP